MDRMLSNNEASSISIPNSLITVPKKVKAKSQQNLSTSDRLTPYFTTCQDLQIWPYL